MSSTASRLAGLILITQQLGRLIERETTLLHEQRPADLAAIQKEKNFLSQAYEREMQALRQNPGLFAAAPPKEQEMLRQVIAGFRGVLDDHRIALKATKEVTERLIKAVSDEVARRDRPLNVYSNYSKKMVAPVRSKLPVSLAVNQVV